MAFLFGKGHFFPSLRAARLHLQACRFGQKPLLRLRPLSRDRLSRSRGQCHPRAAIALSLSHFPVSGSCTSHRCDVLRFHRRHISTNGCVWADAVTRSKRIARVKYLGLNSMLYYLPEDLWDIRSKLSKSNSGLVLLE